MTCEPIRLPNGTPAIVCTRGRRRRQKCWFRGCSADALYQCDAPMSDRKSGTCDRHVCEAHRTRAGRDVDFCPEHADARVLL
jgi:hypothetical protein